MSLRDRITIEPGKMNGQPCIRGMRIRVQDILDMLDGGAEVQQILDNFPYLDLDDVLAAVDFAATDDVATFRPESD